jgi:hypothetical protein
MPSIQKPPVQNPENQHQQPNLSLPDRPIARPSDRPNGRRIISRHAFEVYDDQIDSLRNLSYREKIEGKLGSMSQMVREAIDSYLKTRAPKRT